MTKFCTFATKFFAAELSSQVAELFAEFNDLKAQVLVFVSDLGGTLRRDVAVLKPLVVIYFIRIYSNVALCLTKPEKPLFLYWLLPSQWKTPAVHNVYAFVNGFYACTYWATLMFTLIVFGLFVETTRACLQFR